jgi:hypothetical protein
MRATGFTHIGFPNCTPTQARSHVLLTDGVREVRFERVESVRMSTITTEISTGTPSIERKRSF